MSIDDDLRQAERAGDDARVAAIRQRLGDGPAMQIAAEFRSEILRRKQEITDFGFKIKANQERIDFLEKVCAAILPPSCAHAQCCGRGFWYEWEDQDTRRTIECPVCKGTGFKA